MEAKNHEWFTELVTKAELTLENLSAGMKGTHSTVRDQYYRKCIAYRILLKASHQKYKDWLLYKLMTIEQTNPTAFWETVNKLKTRSGLNKVDNNDQISPNTWFEHFKNLGNTAIEKEPFRKNQRREGDF